MIQQQEFKLTFEQLNTLMVIGCFISIITIMFGYVIINPKTGFISFDYSKLFSIQSIVTGFLIYVIYRSMPFFDRQTFLYKYEQVVLP